MGVIEEGGKRKREKGRRKRQLLSSFLGEECGRRSNQNLRAAPFRTEEEEEETDHEDLKRTRAFPPYFFSCCTVPNFVGRKKKEEDAGLILFLFLLFLFARIVYKSRPCTSGTDNKDCPRAEKEEEEGGKPSFPLELMQHVLPPFLFLFSLQDLRLSPPVFVSQPKRVNEAPIRKRNGAREEGREGPSAV